ncbi:MAG: diphosphomevalonate decarboxylase [Thermoplasmatales archaeon]|nr:diphosphomevalonate decarboxylase [Thermoplasmatales archaeon]MCW6170096.1 diphosphomevalonate decarboxylase [Thermoplasmatales archaeon]
MDKWQRKFIFEVPFMYHLIKEDSLAYSEAIAYPTIGIILLSGISDKNNRIPLHTSAGIAYTGLDSEIFTDTIVYLNHGKQEGFLDGNPVEYSDSKRSPFTIINNHKSSIFEHLNLSSENINVSFRSDNRNILSGSSDAGAAAIGANIVQLSGGVADTEKFENELRGISESVGRSYHGGLTLTWSSGKECSTEVLLPPESFRDYIILGCNFRDRRNPSDTIHESAVRHPAYAERVKRTKERANTLKKYSEEKDIKSIFELSMKDTDDYHNLLEQVNVRVINDRMRKLMNKVRELRTETWMTYIITGGSNVFVPIEKKDLKTVSENLRGMCDSLIPLKVAGNAHVIDSSISIK